jgi:hypothetical protein
MLYLGRKGRAGLGEKADNVGEGPSRLGGKIATSKPTTRLRMKKQVKYGSGHARGYGIGIGIGHDSIAASKIVIK